MLVVADIADSEQSASYYYGPSVFIPETNKKGRKRTDSPIDWTFWSFYAAIPERHAPIHNVTLLRLEKMLVRPKPKKIK